MNSVFPTNPSINQAPKRSNSGREILYIQNQRLLGTGQPVQDAFVSPQPGLMAAREIPPDVADVFNTVLRKYAFRDIWHWLKIDRKDELGRYPPHHFSPISHETLPVPGVRPRLPGSARSSTTSSVFSMPSAFDRSSFASSRTSYSIMSDPGQMTDRNSNILPPEMQMGPSLPLESHGAGIMSPLNKASRSSTVPAAKSAARQRETELEVKKRYFCTACNKGFARKYDWKVHEQRYHEQQFQYPCPDCNQILYAETHFRSHHRDAHGCAQCTHAKEVTREVDPRRRRTAWGCGFCAILLDDWEKRCDHISQHYDDGQRRNDWDHSKVILGLLRQPDIDPAWQSFLISKHGHHPNPPLAIRFSKETTARSHGDNLQLQDLLELGAIGRDVNAIVQLAYEHGIRNAPPAEVKSLDTVKEEDPVSASISPPTDVPQDSVMGSPSTDQTPLPVSSTYFVPSPMEYTTSGSQELQQSPMTIDASGVQSMYQFNTAFSDGMFTGANFIQPASAHHSLQSQPPFADKALPPLPPDSEMLQQAVGPQAAHHGQHSQSPDQAGVEGFDSWSILTGSTFTDDGNGGMVIATFDPRNQF